MRPYTPNACSPPARGYIMKEAAYDQLLVALRKVLGGGVYLSDAMASRLGRNGDEGTDPVDPVGRLSNRELQVLSLIGRGLSSRQAAESLNVSVKTVESHRQSLKRKLNLATNPQLLQYALKWYASRARN